MTFFWKLSIVCRLATVANGFTLSILIILATDGLLEDEHWHYFNAWSLNRFELGVGCRPFNFCEFHFWLRKIQFLITTVSTSTIRLFQFAMCVIFVRLKNSEKWNILNINFMNHKNSLFHKSPAPENSNVFVFIELYRCVAIKIGQVW